MKLATVMDLLPFSHIQGDTGGHRNNGSKVMIYNSKTYWHKKVTKTT